MTLECATNCNTELHYYATTMSIIYRTLSFPSGVMITVCPTDRLHTWNHWWTVKWISKNDVFESLTKVAGSVEQRWRTILHKCPHAFSRAPRARLAVSAAVKIFETKEQKGKIRTHLWICTILVSHGNGYHERRLMECKPVKFKHLTHHK
jgi:hypothetical protein